MLPNNTGTILTALGYEPLTDFECAKVAGEVVINTWSHVDTQPTEQQITDWGTDAAALPSGQLFSAWQAEHGGDAIATAKRIAKELQDSDEQTARIIRAVVKLTVDEINTLRQWITDFKVEVDLANNLASLKTGVAGLPNVPDRTYDQARTSVTNIIDGE